MEALWARHTMVARIPTAQVHRTCVQRVWCLAYSWCFAARDFGLPLGASDEHTLRRSVRSEQRRGRPKELLPEGLRRKWPGASLLLSYRSLRICSFAALVSVRKHLGPRQQAKEPPAKSEFIFERTLAVTVVWHVFSLSCWPAFKSRRDERE